MPNPATLLYSVFHLNLCYSSIEEQRRPDVIERCYWPLLRLARDQGVPLGIETSGYTLDAINSIDPSWVDTLRGLVADGACEFIGSGYAQIAGPLVPAPMNTANLRLGNQVYRTLLDVQPTLALVNEQIYAAGLVEHYLHAGYQGVVMDWDNPARNNSGWSRDLGNWPQRVTGADGQTTPIVWSHSLGFQRFQRYAHGDTGLDDFLGYMTKQTGGQSPAGAYPVYTNDAEVFDYRPGRYKTEASLQDPIEWARIAELYAALGDDDRYRLAPPSDVLKLLDQPGAGETLRLETPAHPLPLKKQDKYSVVRWAVTGRDDTRINTLCWQIYQALNAGPGAPDEDWRELCFLWSSDFRTHITDQRWAAYLDRLDRFHGSIVGEGTPNPAPAIPSPANPPTVERSGRLLEVATGDLLVTIDCARGGAIDSFRTSGPDSPSLVGTLRHGFYDDISLGADWYTGHVVLDPPGQSKVTDLSPAEPEITLDQASGQVTAVFKIETDLGVIEKNLLFCPYSRALTIDYVLHWPTLPLGTLRLGFVTLQPDTFNAQTLFAETENGGAAERFELSGTEIDHGAPASTQVSARTGLGATDGRITVGDDGRQITAKLDQSLGAALPLLTYREVDGSFFCRLAFSLREMDDTLRPEESNIAPLRLRLTLSAT